MKLNSKQKNEMWDAHRKATKLLGTRGHVRIMENGEKQVCLMKLVPIYTTVDNITIVDGVDILGTGSTWDEAFGKISKQQISNISYGNIL